MFLREIGISRLLLEGARAAAVVVFTFCASREAKADEPTKEECVAANEKGSSLRHQQKLRDSQAQFLRCNSTNCPGPVRDDCALQITELQMITPTVRFRVRGPKGEPLARVGLTIDGNELTSWRDETPLPLDPGDHVFSFSADGYKTVVRTAQVQLRTKRQLDIIVLEPASPPPTSAPEGPAASAEVSPQAWSSDARRTSVMALGGGGVLAVILGTYFGLHAKSTYDDALSSSCPGGVRACSSEGVRGVESSHRQAAISTVSFIVAAALVAGAVGLLVTAPANRMNVDGRKTTR